MPVQPKPSDAKAPSSAAPASKPQIKVPPLLFKETQAQIAEIEELCGYSFIAYWNSPGGSVCQNDVPVLNEILRELKPSRKLTLFIKSDGGTGMASLRIVHLLRQYVDRIHAVIPLNCSSAATMIALGADEIHMGPMAYLTAIDTSLTHDLSPIDRDNDRVSVSQDELSRIINAWRKEANARDANPYQALFQHIHPLVIGAVDRASSLSIKLCQEILSYHMRNAKRALDISRKLNSDYPSHSYPITIREARRIGLHVKPLATKLESLLIRLQHTYSEMGQKAVTDYDQSNQHNNEIVSIIEARGMQIHYQLDKDWHYRTEERRWVALNDHSSWRKTTPAKKGFQTTELHLR